MTPYVYFSFWSLIYSNEKLCAFSEMDVKIYFVDEIVRCNAAVTSS